MWILYIALLKYRRIDFISLSSISLNVSIIYREKDSNRLNLESTRFMSRHWNECHLYHWYQAFVCHDWNDHWRWKTGESWAKDLPDRKWLVTGVSAPIYKRDISLNRDQVYSPLGGSSHHGSTYTKSWSSMTTGWFRVPWLNGNLHDSIDDSWDWIPCSRSVALRRYARLWCSLCTSSKRTWSITASISLPTAGIFRIRKKGCTKKNWPNFVS